MNEVTLVSHDDVDGIVSISIALKKLYEQRPKIYFTTAAKLRRTLADLISRAKPLDRIFLFDIPGDEITILLSSGFNQATWIDHHEWEVSSYPPNVEVIVDRNAASATELVAKYFNVSSELVEITNEIDRDQIKTKEAEFLRNLVGALKWKYSGVLLYNKLLWLSKTFFLQGLEKLEQNMSIARLLDSYSKFLERVEERIFERTKIFKIDGMKVAVYETTKFFPMYVLTKKLSGHEEAPFNIIIGLIRQIRNGRRIYTKLELRTHTAEGVYTIAKEFGGGGHRVAAGATMTGFLTLNELVDKIRKLKE